MCDFNLKINFTKLLKSTTNTSVIFYRLTFRKSSFYDSVNKTIVSNSKGQAMVEYILMLVVTLTLLLGLATKLIPQLSDFMQNYAGAYVECLLETGELPPPLNLNPNSLCTLENMRTTGRLENTSSGSGGSGGSRPNRATSSNDNNSANRGNSGGQGGSRGNSGSSQSPRPRTGANTGADSSAGGSSSGGRGASRGSKLAAAANAAEAANAQRGQGAGGGASYAAQQDNGRGITGVVKIPNTATLKDSDKPLSNKIKSDKKLGGENLRKGSFTAPITKPKENSEATNSSMDLGFPYGLYLRYFLIGGLILALILMVGTQLNSLRKSWGSE